MLKKLEPMRTAGRFWFYSVVFCLGKKGRRKARKTDASDLTPNPQKLHNIGEQLQKLNAAIDGMGPVNDLPAVARARSRKEKNKLASRYQTEFKCPPSYIQRTESEPRRRFPIDLSAKSGLFERFSVVVNAEKKISCRALWFVVCRWTFGLCGSVFRFGMHLDIWPFNTYWRTRRIHWGKTSTFRGIWGLVDLTVWKMAWFCCLTFLFVRKRWIPGLRYTVFQWNTVYLTGHYLLTSNPLRKRHKCKVTISVFLSWLLLFNEFTLDLSMME